jgi:hypothetical protein
VPRQRGATTLPKQAEATVEQLCNSTNPKGAGATRREFNGKCDPVKPAADPGHNRRIDIAQRSATAARDGPLHEKLSGGRPERFHGSQIGVVGRTIK